MFLGILDCLFLLAILEVQSLLEHLVRHLLLGCPDYLEILLQLHLGNLDCLARPDIQHLEFLDCLDFLECLVDLDFLVLLALLGILLVFLDNQQFLAILEDQLRLGDLDFLGFLVILVLCLVNLGLLVILLFPVGLVDLVIRVCLANLEGLLYLVQYLQKQQNHANLVLKCHLDCYRQICTITPLRS